MTRNQAVVSPEQPRTPLPEKPNPPAPASWLIRLPEVFLECEARVLEDTGCRVVRKPGRDYRLVRCPDPMVLRDSAAAKFVSWNLPMHHLWPCQPRETAGFVEKAARALAEKFGPLGPQAVLTGALDPGEPGRYHRTLASNLRGRLLQLMPAADEPPGSAEEQDPRAPTLFCLLGKEGLFCGMQSPLECGGFYPGGTRFIRQSGPEAISRAGAKIAEALHHLRLHRPPPPPATRWLELGASPGGMTAELLARGYRVTAIDRAPLDPRILSHNGLRALVADAGIFTPPPGETYGAILSDMNGDPAESLARVIRLTRWLDPGGLVVFTLKTAGVTGYDALNQLEKSAVHSASAAGLHKIAVTHLTYNRQEFTLLLEKSGA